jgi:hypothetical protein
MHETWINYWAVLAAAASNFVIGGIWYSPPLFVKPWLKMSGVSEETFNSGLPKALIGDVVSSLLMAFVLACILGSIGKSLVEGLMVSAAIWLGFIASVILGSVTYEHKPIGYFLINAGYRLVSILAMGAILTLWR